MKAIAIVEALKALAVLFVAALFISTTATAEDTRVAELPATAAVATVAMVTPTKASVVVVKPAPKATRPPQGKRAAPPKGRSQRAADWQLENPQLG
jgi:hypothetical protein